MKKIFQNRKKTKQVIGILLLVLFFMGGGLLLLSDSYGLNYLRKLVEVAPGEGETKKDYETLLNLAEKTLNTNGEVRTYLILFQNNMELRPGGGFIGSFGVLKIKDGQLVDLQVHDVVNTDFRVEHSILAPYPMEETLGVDTWSFRDSNFSPHFPENVDNALRFYKIFGGTEEFDGVIGITTHVLESILRVTGPVAVPGFPDTYDAENGVYNLERQVEIAFVEQGIERGARKSVMKDLAFIILEKAKALPLTQKYELFKILLDDLHSKDIQVSFKDPSLQATVDRAGWAGKMDNTWQKDYFQVVDSNMNSFKSDHFINRSYRYDLDATVSPAKAKLTVSYEHTAKEKDWLVKDYQTYLRIYLPKDAFVTSVSESKDEPRYGEYLGKKWVGMLETVPLGTKKSVSIEYTLPAERVADYDLLIERQAGIKEDTKVELHLKGKNGMVEKTFTLDRNKKLSEVE